MRATSVPAFFCQNAGARSEYAHLRANMSGATAQRRLRAHLGSKGEPLGAFSSPILCGKAKNRHPKQAQRGAQQYARQKEKSFKFFAVCDVGWQNFLLSATPYDHTARPCRALIGLLLYATSWRFPRSSQEGNPGVPPGNPLGIRRGVAASGCLCRQALGKDFCFPFLLEIYAKSGA